MTLGSTCSGQQCRSIEWQPTLVMKQWWKSQVHEKEIFVFTEKDYLIFFQVPEVAIKNKNLFFILSCCLSFASAFFVGEVFFFLCFPTLSTTILVSLLSKEFLYFFSNYCYSFHPLIQNAIKSLTICSLLCFRKVCPFSWL